MLQEMLGACCGIDCRGELGGHMRKIRFIKVVVPEIVSYEGI